MDSPRTARLIKSAIYGLAGAALAANAAQLDIAGPPASSAFGTGVFVLRNGNIVVTDPGWNAGAGAVHLYSPVGVLISSLTGDSAGDQVGIGGLDGKGGVALLGNGHFVVSSPSWDSSTNVNVGAVTWVDGSTGISGVVSSANSLVGTRANDSIGNFGITVLGNGNYVVSSASWDNGATQDAGAVTWGNGSSGRSGPVSASNSLVGTSASDAVGNAGVTALSNGNYVVASASWSNGAVADVGAATWGNGAAGSVGAVSAGNSLIGTTRDDHVGIFGIVALTNGNYVVVSTDWDNTAAFAADVGAVTWADGATGLAGAVSPGNSLVGTTGRTLFPAVSGDQVGHGGVTALRNGNYVVATPGWDSGPGVDLGAATWADGRVPLSGEISLANSLLGSRANDRVAGFGVFALTNGNYVVASGWSDATLGAGVGAATWADGTTGIAGRVSRTNSLTGASAGDAVGFGGVTALSNGNYVVRSPRWAFGPNLEAGAVTWGDGSTGRTGAVSASNSLHGRSTNDRVGDFGVTALDNGHYVVSSDLWNNAEVGFIPQVGAVTWANGIVGLAGAVSSANSLVGTSADDRVGDAGIAAISGVTALRNGHYVVRSPFWDNGAIADVGAVTWANGSTRRSEAVAPGNSLIGSASGDRVGGVNDSLGGGSVTALSDGNYVVVSPAWDNGAAADAGAVTLLHGEAGGLGTILPSNSVRGTVAGAGSGLVFGYDAARKQLAVGRPAGNILSLFTLPPDLGISKTDGVTNVSAGGTVTYTIVATNRSPTSAATGIVADTFAAPLTGCTWTCSGTGGNTCSASGTGNINDVVGFVAGGSVRYTVACTVSAAGAGTLSNTASITGPADPNGANNSSTDDDTLIARGDDVFRDGFE